MRFGLRPLCGVPLFSLTLDFRVRNMGSAYYRSGQAARVWGISSHLVRRLCEAGLIEAEQTDGGQWKIPRFEVDRINKEGIPEIPSPIESDKTEEEEEGPKSNGLLAPPSGEVVTSAEEVVVAENQLKKLKIDRETEETRDWFRGRQRTEAETASREQHAATDRAARSQAERDQIVWHDSWIAIALLLLPQGVPTEDRLVVRETVTEALAGLGPQHSRQVIEPLVTAAVVKALKPWVRSGQSVQAIEKACDSLPWGAKNPFSPTVWQLRAKEAAAAAVRKLSSDSTYDEKLCSARAAVLQITTEFEHSELKKRLLETYLWDISDEDRDDAKEAISKRLDSMPIGTPPDAMERARNLALVPFQEANRTRDRVEQSLAHIQKYVERLQRAGETDFESPRDVWHFARGLERQVRSALAEELQNNDLNDDELFEFIEELVDEALA